jgi:hypothetical protein
MAGLLIRWLEDLVESPPPRRAGTSPEEHADALLYATCTLSYELSVLVHGSPKVSENSTNIYASLPRPGAEKLRGAAFLADALCLMPGGPEELQSAWNRLVTTHLPHLPPPARLALYITLAKIGAPEAQEQIARDALVEVFGLIESGALVADVGRGLRRCLIPEIIAAISGRLLENPKCPPLFTAKYADGSLQRRLTWMVYYNLLTMAYLPQQRAFDPPRAREVRGDRFRSLFSFLFRIFSAICIFCFT